MLAITILQAFDIVRLLFVDLLFGKVPREAQNEKEETNELVSQRLVSYINRLSSVFFRRPEIAVTLCGQHGVEIISSSFSSRP